MPTGIVRIDRVTFREELMTDELRQRIVSLLERAKHDHYEDGHEGAFPCDKLVRPELACDCGADQINAEIDAMILELSGCDVLGISLTSVQQ